MKLNNDVKVNIFHHFREGMSLIELTFVSIWKSMTMNVFWRRGKTTGRSIIRNPKVIVMSWKMRSLKSEKKHSDNNNQGKKKEIYKGKEIYKEKEIYKKKEIYKEKDIYKGKETYKSSSQRRRSCKL